MRRLTTAGRITSTRKMIVVTSAAAKPTATVKSEGKREVPIRLECRMKRDRMNAKKVRPQAGDCETAKDRYEDQKRTYGMQNEYSSRSLFDGVGETTDVSGKYEMEVWRTRRSSTRHWQPYHQKYNPSVAWSIRQRCHGLDLRS